MSFVPQPQRQNANSQNAVTPTSGAPAPVDDAELIFNIRTFDLFFIDRQSLMFRDGYAKVSDSFSVGWQDAIFVHCSKTSTHIASFFP